MIYLAGDTNLTEEMVLALQSLVAAGPPVGDKIMAQFDPSGMGLATQRYVFNGLKNGLPDRTLEHYRDKTFDSTETSTGSPETLIEFIRWAAGHRQEKARSDATDGLGHGTGFLRGDEHPPHSLRSRERHDRRLPVER